MAVIFSNIFELQNCHNVHNKHIQNSQSDTTNKTLQLASKNHVRKQNKYTGSHSLETFHLKYILMHSKNNITHKSMRAYDCV